MGRELRVPARFLRRTIQVLVDRDCPLCINIPPPYETRIHCLHFPDIGFCSRFCLRREQNFAQKENGSIVVNVNDKLFTRYVYKDPKEPNPSFIRRRALGANAYPKYPMEEAAEGEAEDHPHHTSLWYTHGK